MFAITRKHAAGTRDSPTPVGTSRTAVNEILLRRPTRWCVSARSGPFLLRMCAARSKDTHPVQGLLVIESQRISLSELYLKSTYTCAMKPSWTRHVAPFAAPLRPSPACLRLDRVPHIRSCCSCVAVCGALSSTAACYAARLSRCDTAPVFPATLSSRVFPTLSLPAADEAVTHSLLEYGAMVCC